MTKYEYIGFSLDKGLKFIEPELKINGRLVIHQKILTVNCYNFHSIINNNKLLILRPLSDLTKEIEHDGEMFVPMIRLAELKVGKGLWVDIAPYIPFSCKIVKKPFGKLAKCTKIDDWVIIINMDDPSRADFWIIQKLIEWHFAVGLSEDDYIDVNTLEVNPYK